MAQRRKKKALTLEDAIRLVSPGTALRESISLIMQGHLGALICIGNMRRVTELSEQGVEINTPFSPQLLYELAKMDGAVILSDDMSSIRCANRFLKPNTSILSQETGTRHRAAERIAHQASCLVIAVSERRQSVTLYVGDEKHTMDSIPTLLNKATQAVQTLEKYISVLGQVMTDLSTREFEDMVTIFDVCKAVQRCEMVWRIADEIKPFILELGTEGRLIDMQLRELLQPIAGDSLVIKDYYVDKQGNSYEGVRKKIMDVSQKELIGLENIAQAIGYGSNMKSIDTYLSPRGYRILTETRRIPAQIIENLVDRFGSLQAIARAPKEELVAVEGVGEVLAERVRVSLNSARSQLALDRGRR